jgi:hypothetical protein
MGTGEETLIMKRFQTTLAAGLLLAALPAFAHHPFGECRQVDRKTVRCTGGFDEKPVPGLRIDILDDQDKILIRGRLDAKASFTFDKPAVPFYVLIDAGPGQVVGIDDTEVK